MSAFTFEFPMPPSVTNASGASRHWRTMYARKKAYWQTLDALQSAGKIAAPPRTAFRLCRVRSTMYLGGAMDDDNALARHKACLDWLKTRGYIADDRKKNLIWEALPEQVVKRIGNYRIVLTLTPMSDGE